MTKQQNNNIQGEYINNLSPKKLPLFIQQQVQKPKYSHNFIIIQCLITCLGSLYFGYSMGELNMAQKKLNMAYNISEENKATYIGILNAIMPLGATIGSIVTGTLLKSNGRRQLILISDCIGILGCLLFLIANFWIATIARFIMGLIVGANSTIIPQFIREISPSKILPKTEIFLQGFLNGGILLAYLIGLGFPIDENELEDQSGFYWRFNLLFPIIPLSIRALSFLLVYKNDTITYYLIKNNEQKAKTVISQYYETQQCQNIFQKYKNDVDAKQKQDNTWKYIFTRIYIKRTLISCMLFFFLQFSGINAIVFYSSDIFEKTLGSQSTANYMTVICGVEMTILGFISSQVSKKYGRKMLYCLGLIILAIINICAGIIAYLTKDQDNIDTVPGILLISCIFLYYLFFNYTIGPLSWVYNAEINSSENAIGLATAVNWMSSCIISLVFPILTDEFGVYSVFWIFGGFCIVGTIILSIFALETHNLSTDKIIKLYTKNYDIENIKNDISIEKSKSIQVNAQDQKQNSTPNSDNKVTVNELQNFTQQQLPAN